MRLSARVQGRSYRFRSVCDALARASEPKAGDSFAKLGATSACERAAAKMVLAGLTLGDLRTHPAVPARTDAVTRAIDADVNETVYAEIRPRTVGDLRDWLLADTTSVEQIRRTGRALTGEMAASVAKLCSNLDLVYGARKMPVTTRARSTIGLRGCMATRLQANHPAGDPEGITATIYEGLAYGAGDALVSIDPGAADARRITELFAIAHDLIDRLQIPTQSCMLASAAAQTQALQHGVPLDVFTHALAGTEPALSELGVSVAQLDEARALILNRGALRGTQLMHFRTSQGTEATRGAHCSVDQTTLSARALALARRYNPLLVDSTTGQQGAAALADGRQLIRAGLEDHFMGKLLGVPAGALACHTIDTAADENDCENLAALLASAGVNALAVAALGDDLTSGTRSSSFHDAPTLRQTLALRPAPEFESWLVERGLMANGRLTSRAGDPNLFLRG